MNTCFSSSNDFNHSPLPVKLIPLWGSASHHDYTYMYIRLKFNGNSNTTYMTYVPFPKIKSGDYERKLYDCSTFCKDAWFACATRISSSSKCSTSVIMTGKIICFSIFPAYQLPECFSLSTYNHKIVMLRIVPRRLHTQLVRQASDHSFLMKNIKCKYCMMDGLIA